MNSPISKYQMRGEILSVGVMDCDIDYRYTQAVNSRKIEVPNIIITVTLRSSGG